MDVGFRDTLPFQTKLLTVAGIVLLLTAGMGVSLWVNSLHWDENTVPYNR